MLLCWTNKELLLCRVYKEDPDETWELVAQTKEELLNLIQELLLCWVYKELLLCRVYKEDPDEETCELVAQTKEELLTLIQELREGRAVALPPTHQAVLSIPIQV